MYVIYMEYNELDYSISATDIKMEAIDILPLLLVPLPYECDFSVSSPSINSYTALPAHDIE